MGQTVEIRSAVTIDDVLLIDTDRSFTGQDGQEITRDDPGDAVPAKLAADLFDSDDAINHVYVLQNTISVGREGGWDESSADAARKVTERFLRFYED